MVGRALALSMLAGLLAGLLLSLLLSLPTALQEAGCPGSVSPDTASRLLALGWISSPADGAERIYQPGGLCLDVTEAEQ